VRIATDTAMASGMRPVVVVTGRRSTAIEQALPNGVDVVKAHDAHKGVAHSLRALVRSLEGWRTIEAVCVGLADQPLVGPDAYRRLADAYDPATPRVVATYGGRRGNPVLLGRPLWPQVAHLKGDVGARALMDSVAVREIDCTDTGRPDDIDTPADLERVAREMET
jgi:molybdenum cofactor cytidylyltransferase